MTNPLSFLIIDGYPKASRDELAQAGMTPAWKLYANMLLTYLPKAEFEVFLPSDEGAKLPEMDQLQTYSGLLWTGCNLCILDTDNPSVRSQIDLARTSYALGIPSYGSCWGLQMAVVAAGGRVAINPKGRELGLARKIVCTKAGERHPFYEGKPRVFDGFISHDDMVAELPGNGIHLSGNGWTGVQAAAVTHQKGTFWAVQYHPEYDLREMACLISARSKQLIELGFYKNQSDLEAMVDRMKALHADPQRKDLRWQLGIDDDVLDAASRQREFINWLNKLILKK